MNHSNPDQQQQNKFGIPPVQPPTARQALKFLFLPDLKGSVSPLKDAGQMFVKLVALVFAQQGLFPRNHPALTTDARIDFAEVFRTAYQNLRWTKAGTPQLLFFFAVVGMLACSIIAVLSLIFGLIMGGAHAAGTFDFAEKDMSCDVIKYLFVLKNDFCVGGGVKFFEQTAVRNGILAIFQFYSNAMLIFAAFILMYHLVSMIAETAHQGVVMGRRANQIWAPIRLIVAIGLLVPINGSLSTGQKIVIQIAAWGSGMGSQAWAKFVDKTIGTSSVTISGAPDLSGFVTSLINSYACMYAYNLTSDVTDYKGKYQAFIKPKRIDGQNGSYEVLFTNTISTEGAVCGSYKVPARPKEAGPAQSFYDLQQSVLSSHLEEIESVGYKLAQAFHSTNSNKSKSIESLPRGLVSDLTDKYNQAARYSNANTNVSEAQATSMKQLSDQAKDWGWIAAGAWPLSITTATQAIITNQDASLPSAIAPNPGATKYMFTGSYLGAFDGASRSSHNTGVDSATSVLEQIINWTKQTGIARERYTGAKSDDPTVRTVMNTSSNSNLGGSTAATAIMDKIFWACELILQQKGIWIDRGQHKGAVNVDFQANHPLIEFIGLGQRWLAGSLEIMGYGVAAFAANGLGPAVGSAVAAASGVVAYWMGYSGYVGITLAAIFGAVGGPGVAAVLLTLGGVGFMFSMTIAFYLTIVPFLKFFFHVLTWMMMLIEAVLSVPIFAIAHLTIDGDGLPGQLARRGYFQLFGIFLRPLLVVIGLIVGLLVFTVAATIVDKLYHAATMVSGGSEGIHTNSLSHILFTVFYMLILYICANSAFKAMGWFTEQSLNWINAGTWQDKMGDKGTMEGMSNQLLGAVALQTMGQGFSQIGKENVVSKYRQDKKDEAAWAKRLGRS